jgi:hypothetical protein
MTSDDRGRSSVRHRWERDVCQSACPGRSARRRQSLDNRGREREARGMRTDTVPST